MKQFENLSGPWTGLSLQGPRRLTEAIKLRITNGVITGEGSDVDGDFVLDGRYDPTTEFVQIDRRYTYVARPEYGSTWVVYRYQGKWDGAMVYGHWNQCDSPSNCGGFEMWPNREEDRMELAIDIRELTHVGG